MSHVTQIDGYTSLAVTVKPFVYPDKGSYEQVQVSRASLQDMRSAVILQN